MRYAIVCDRQLCLNLNLTYLGLTGRSPMGRPYMRPGTGYGNGVYYSIFFFPFPICIYHPIIRTKKQPARSSRQLPTIAITYLARRILSHTSSLNRTRLMHICHMHMLQLPTLTLPTLYMYLSLSTLIHHFLCDVRSYPCLFWFSRRVLEERVFEERA